METNEWAARREREAGGRATPRWEIDSEMGQRAAGIDRR
jgi:hypothetical protein